jgi:K+-transporting ATPase ATPase C chain
MRRDLISSLLAILVMTLLLGVAYPLVVTGIAQVTFPGNANGQQIKAGGKVVGSRLVGQATVIDTGRKDKDGNPITRPNPRYFQPRPSATGYDPAATFFSNRGPNQVSARDFFREQLKAYLAFEGHYSPGLTASTVPVDAVTTSASGVDRHISQANAAIQAHRVATVRHLPPARVTALVRSHTDGRFLGVFGEPGVNVTTLNLALARA